MDFFDFFRIVYDEVFAVQLLAVSFSLVWIFYSWQKEKRNIIIGVLHIVCVFAVGTVLNWLLFALSYVWRSIGGTHFIVGWFLTVFLYLGLFCKKTYITSRIVVGATLFISIISMVDLGREVMNCCESSDGGAYFGWICFLCSLLIVAFSFVIRRYSLRSYSDIPRRSVLLIMINAVSSAILIFVKTVMKVQTGFSQGEPFYCIVLALIYIISFTGYLMIYFHCKMHRENTVFTVQNKLLEADKQTLVISEQAIEEMRSLRHDMKNQINVMRMMLDDGKYDELKEYFDSVVRQINQATLSEFIDCGNQLINFIVNMEILKATSYGVKLITKINVPDSLPFEQSDLCRVLVNVIDNAIEGILRTERRDYLVDLKIAVRGDYLYICVQNEIRDDIDRESLLKMNTSKEDSVYHGYGHKIVQKIVENYNGYVNYSVVGSEFIAEIMLEIKSRNGETE